MRVELHPEARSELRSAALWYEERRSGFGDRLVERLNETIDRIGAAPGSYPSWPNTEQAPVAIHRAPVEQFPYFVAFEIHAGHVLVLAIAHGKRRPLYWFSRAMQGSG